jgi:hypothetical protein
MHVPRKLSRMRTMSLCLSSLLRILIMARQMDPYTGSQIVGSEAIRSGVTVLQLSLEGVSHA